MGEGRSMLPIQAILNQPYSHPSRADSPASQPLASESPSPISDDTGVGTRKGTGSGTFNLISRDYIDVRNISRRVKKGRDSSDLSYMRPPGPIKYAPYEDLDEAAHELMRPFEIIPFGEIAQFCAHVPYSSDKKDVYSKTGRESFNVFVYKFTNPSDAKTYDVMWDYLGGFVRISPFFKSREHKKTGPAKMLDVNKGLRDVTFHMTGGNRVAQGYWTPYACARAVCAAFCHPIAGALIPIFGPDFPRDCIKPESPRYGCMEIDEAIIQKAKLDVKAYKYSSLNSMARPAVAASSSSSSSSSSGITSNPILIRPQPPPPFHDQYSTSMKERLEDYSAERADRSNRNNPYSHHHLHDRHHQQQQHNHAIALSRWHPINESLVPPTGPLAPPHGRVIGWAPINPSRHDSFPPASPWLSAVPRPSTPRPPVPAPIVVAVGQGSSNRNIDNSPKRRWYDEADYAPKRPKLHLPRVQQQQGGPPPHHPQRVYSEDMGSGHGPSHSGDVAGQPESMSGQRRSEDGRRSRSPEDLEVACILMDMPRERGSSAEGKDQPQSV